MAFDPGDKADLRRRAALTAAAATLLPAAAGAALLAAAAAGRAQQRASLTDPLRLGIDRGLADALVGRALVSAFGRDTGIAVKVENAASSRVLESLERGELDVAVTDAPALEARLVEQGLAHDRRELGRAEFVLIGPAATRKQPDPAAIAGERDVLAALRRIHAAQARFVSAGDGSGGHLLEQALWREAQLAPAAPWYGSAGAAGVLADARASGAYALVERGAFAALAAAARAPVRTPSEGSALAVLVERDARLALPVHAMRAFRSAHPAARLFVAWVAGAKGRSALSRLVGFR